MPNLSETRTVILDAFGNGTVGIGPLSAREVWHPASVHVSVSTDTNEAVCNIYVGDAAAQRCFRDATSSGSLGDSSDRVANDTIQCGHKVFAQWIGGDPHAVASLTVTGTKDI